jgi:hypothetical protein
MQPFPMGQKSQIPGSDDHQRLLVGLATGGDQHGEDMSAVGAQAVQEDWRASSIVCLRPSRTKLHSGL